ncbi:hypothetical protein OG609_19835 [Streptomyces sp. NBC_01224]|uniref:hypothetical protein n=1 Tax=Streptomyces sp. NBC_01224 TaxID=2903783 RepID=UPI002E11AB90|nr:hypothetical protein OG609_19835 [Streptomyces sp. NBC_01224]
MGLMSWLRGGGRTETGTGTAAGTGTGSAGAAPAAVPRERVDLAELPPIQRTLGAQDLVIDPSGFQGSLSTRQDTSLGTPLGHLVSPDAPTGLVHGITTPASVGRPSPVQRSVERPVELPVRARSVPLSVPVQRAAVSGAPAMTSAGESAVAELPVRQLVGEQPFAPASAPEPAPESAAPEPATPLPPVQRSVTPPVVDRPRRAPGLGAPMSALPPTAQRQAAHAGPETEGAAGVVPVARSAADDSAGEVPEAPEVPAAPESAPESDGPTAPLLGDDPLLPAPSESAPAPSAASSSAPSESAPAPSVASSSALAESAPAPTPASSSTPAVQRTPAVPAQAPLSPPPVTAPVAPLLADRPLSLQSGQSGGAGVVQRSAVDGAAASPSGGAGPVPGPGLPSLPDAVPVRWTSAGAGAPSVAPAASLPAALQRTAMTPGEATGAPSRPLFALQRQTVGGPPVPRSLPGAGSRTAPAAPAAPSFPTAGSVAVAAGVAQRMADGSVVFGSPPPPYSSPVVQRETETTEPPPPDPPQEPEPEPEPGPMAEDHGAPGAAASAPGAPPGQSGGHGGAAAPVVTDELVRALYTPLSRLFKADLRLERERAGFLINTRH